MGSPDSSTPAHLHFGPPPPSIYSSSWAQSLSWNHRHHHQHRAKYVARRIKLQHRRRMIYSGSMSLVGHTPCPISQTCCNWFAPTKTTQCVDSWQLVTLWWTHSPAATQTTHSWACTVPSRWRWCCFVVSPLCLPPRWSSVTSHSRVLQICIVICGILMPNHTDDQSPTSRRHQPLPHNLYCQDLQLSQSVN